MPSNNEFTVSWICTSDIELLCAKNTLDEAYHASSNKVQSYTVPYTLGRIGPHNVVIADLQDFAHDTASADAVVPDIRWTFPSIKFGLIAGPGSGIPQKGYGASLGDIVVSCPSSESGVGAVIRFREEKTEQGREFTSVWNATGPHRAIMSAIPLAESKARLTGFKIPSYSSHQRESYDVLYGPTYNKQPEHDPEYNPCGKGRVVQRESGHLAGPKIHTGPVACLGATKRDVLGEQHGVIGVKQGAAGMIAAGFPITVICGIADYADSHSLNNKHWRKYAAVAAAAYTKELLGCIPHYD